MQSIKTLVIILKILGLIGIILGFIFLVLSLIYPASLYPRFIFILLNSTPAFFSALIILCLARGLSKMEKWAWHAGLLIFSLALVSAIMGILDNQSISDQLPSFSLGILSVIMLSDLIIEREVFIKQPKEKISQWFRKPCFLGVIIGVVLNLINAGFLNYFQNRMFDLYK